MIRPESMSRTLALLALFCLLPGLAFANAGKILFAQGEVVVVDADGERAPVDTGHELEEGDRIKTGAEARTQIRLSDGALISLRANSDYQIVAQKTEEGLMEQAGKLFSGWMRTVTGTIGEENPDAVEQETPVATIGIRGTTYQVIHMPEGGLPGVPESEPGSYFYVQQGSIETSAGGENRFLEPGDVAYVPLDGGPPVPAPGKKELFGGHEGEDTDAADGDVSGVKDDNPQGNTNADEEQQINDGLNEAASGPPPFENPGASVHAYGSDFLDTNPDTIQLESRGGRQALVYVEGTSQMLGGDLALEADTGAEPDNTGTHILDSGEDRIDWGVWAQSDYSMSDVQNGSELTKYGPWHYMVGSNVIEEFAELDSMGLTGSWNYEFVGGTGLSNTGGASLSLEPDSSAVVDFTNMNMRVVLEVQGQSVQGVDQIEAFYGGGVNIIGGDYSGQIQGMFSGKDAEGIISNIRLDVMEGPRVSGTAAFEQSGSSSQEVVLN